MSFFFRRGKRKRRARASPARRCTWTWARRRGRRRCRRSWRRSARRRSRPTRARRSSGAALSSARPLCVSNASRFWQQRPSRERVPPTRERVGTRYVKSFSGKWKVPFERFDERFEILRDSRFSRFERFEEPLRRFVDISKMDSWKRSLKMSWQAGTAGSGGGGVLRRRAAAHGVAATAAA